MDGSRGVLVDEVALGNGRVGHCGGLGRGEVEQCNYPTRKRATAGLYIIIMIAARCY